MKGWPLLFEIITEPLLIEKRRSERHHNCTEVHELKPTANFWWGWRGERSGSKRIPPLRSRLCKFTIQIHLVRHVEWNSFLEEGQRSLRVSTRGGDMNQSTSVLRPSSYPGLVFIDEDFHDRSVAQFGGQVQRGAIHL